MGVETLPPLMLSSIWSNPSTSKCVCIRNHHLAKLCSNATIAATEMCFCSGLSQYVANAMVQNMHSLILCPFDRRKMIQWLFCFVASLV